MNKELQTQPDQNPEWNSELISDLSFIKKNLRYPMSRKTIIPALRTAVSLVSFIVLGYIFLFKHENKGGNIGSVIVLLMSGLVTFTAIIRVLQSLRFIAVPTDLFAERNMQLVKNFLESERFVVFRHPEAPEVFQIISKDVNAHNYKGGEQREILIFIADDKRILLNSHFTSEKKSFFQQIRRGHHREMAAMLQRYIDSINSTDAGKAVTRR